MDNRNPYAAPRTNVAAADEAESYGDVSVFSAKGRLGRLRFIGYSAGVSILILLAFGIVAGLVALVSPDLAVVVAIVGYVAIIVVQVLLTIQRSHDMNVTGWLSLISFVPLGALVFWLVPGTKGENRYGLPPPPNTAGVVVLALIMPFIAIIGILAAIAIPAYQDYTIRAQVSEGLNLAAATKLAVAEAFERTGAAPASRFDAGLSSVATDSGGKYVESVDVARGTILVTYGENANGIIAGRMLALQPYVAPDRSVVWRCGFAPAPAGAVAMDSVDGIDSVDYTDVEPRHLPSACRP